jgi:putative cell wall-binding protein
MKTTIVLAVLACAGCTHIPPASVKEYHRTTTVMGVTSTSDYTDIKVTEKTAKAGSAKFVLSFPGFYNEQRVTELVLPNPPEKK